MNGNRYGGRLVTGLAREVNISHLENLYGLKRTVQSYVENIKDKPGVRTKREILKKLLR